jgi:AraC-like DNA-binding protein
MEDIVYTLPIIWFEKTCGIAKDANFEHPIYRNYPTKYIAFSLCTSGSFKMYCNKKEIILSKNELLVILDHEIIDYYNEHSPDFNRYFLIVSYDFLKSLSHSDTMNQGLFFKNYNLLELTDEEMEYMVDLFRMVKKTIEYKANEGRKENMLKTLFNLLREIIEYTNSYQNRVNNNIDSRMLMIVTNFGLLLETYHNQSREVSFYADKLCVSTNYLYKVTKTVLNVSPKDFINNRIILQAKYLLDTKKEKNVQEIAIELGFQSQSFFGKFFKQQTGMSPSDYRLFSNQNNEFTPPANKLTICISDIY